MKRACKILKWLMVLTLGWAVVYIIGGIVNCLTTCTSFPWYSVFAFAAIYFGPVLLVEIVAYAILRRLLKRK